MKSVQPKYDRYRPHQRIVERGEKIHPVTGEVTIPPSRTKQAHKAECDINNIIKQYKTSGMVTHINANAQVGAYLDLPDQADFQTAMNTVLVAQQSFATLPAKVRSRFGNDPAEFLAFMSNADNLAEARELGLVNPAPPEPPPPAPPPPPADKPQE